MKTGAILRVFHDRPFAFIAPDAKGEADVFLHQRAILEAGHDWDEQLTGRRVSYSTAAGRKGLRAENVCLL